MEKNDKLRDLPLVYFYSGRNLPRYAEQSIAHAARKWGGDVILLTDVVSTDANIPAEVIDYRTWFDQSELESLLRANDFDTDFRDGFWSKTLARIFVLEQFMKFYFLQRLAHLELDSILFITQEEFKDLPLDAEGLYVPWNPGSPAIGSFLYANGQNALTSLVAFATSGPKFNNEMQLLTNFLEQHPQEAHGLPTADRMMYGSTSFSPKNSIPLRDSEFVFDANRLGMWAYGTDPRNTKSWISLNHHEEPGLSNYPKLNHTHDGSPIIIDKDGGPSKRVANIHVHSKRVSQATRPLKRFFWFRIANLPFKVIVGLNLRKKLGAVPKFFLSLVDKSVYRFVQSHILTQKSRL